MPLGFGTFTAKIAKLDKKLVLPPETALLVREQVARINVCLFCIDIGRSFTIKASMNQAKFDALDEYGTSALFSDGERAMLDYVTELTRDKKVNPETFARMRSYYSGTRDMRDRVAGGERALLQYDQHRSEYSFGYALRHQQEESVDRLHDESFSYGGDGVCREPCGARVCGCGGGVAAADAIDEQAGGD